METFLYTIPQECTMKFPLPDLIPTGRPDVELRRLSLIDSPQLHKLLFCKEAEPNKQLLNLSSENHWTRFEEDKIFSEALKDPEGTYYGTRIGETLIGGACARTMEGAPDEVRIGFWIAPKYSGHGYATCIATAMNDAAFAAGYKNVWAAVRPGSPQKIKAQIVLMHSNFDVHSIDMERHLTWYARFVPDRT